MKNLKNICRRVSLTAAAAGALAISGGTIWGQALIHYPAVVVKDAAKGTRAVAVGGERCVKATAHGAAEAVRAVGRI